MIRSLFTATTGMSAMQQNIDVIANNLANVNTQGFKRSRAEFQDLLYRTLKMPGTATPTGNQVPTGIQIGMGSKLSAVTKLLTQGDMLQTENQLDIAIQGRGFFQIQQPDGSVAYTRAGTFRSDSSGMLVNSDGLPLEPAITIPEDATSISIAENGEVSVMQAGSTTPNILGTIEIASFINPAGLLAMGSGLYTETDASGTANAGIPGENELGVLLQGYIESSNVNVVEELTGMIMAQRAYELNSKAITTADEMLQTANGTKR
ncbi:MAG: flagellar basal-body rod protein FlgG [Nitrospinota bacterium]